MALGLYRAEGPLTELAREAYSAPGRAGSLYPLPPSLRRFKPLCPGGTPQINATVFCVSGRWGREVGVSGA